MQFKIHILSKSICDSFNNVRTFSIFFNFAHLKILINIPIVRTSFTEEKYFSREIHDNDSIFLAHFKHYIVNWNTGLG